MLLKGTFKCNFKGDFTNGKREGTWVEYWSSGQLMFKGDFKNGKRDAVWIYFNKNGTVNEKYTGSFKNGKKIIEE